MHIQENTDLKNYTSLKTGGQAALLIEIEQSDNLTELISQYQSKLPICVLGYGTNCLISDKGLPGTVILNRIGKIEVLGDGKIRADSGANWDELVQTAIANNLWGVEFMSGIPGGVGAAVAGSITAYGHRVSDSFVEAKILNSQDGSIETWDNSQAGFKYRSSNLQNPENAQRVVLSATFQLSTEPGGELEYESALKISRDIGVAPDTLANRRKIILEARRRAGSLLLDPANSPGTAGSFFKNPIVNEAQLKNLLSFEEKTLDPQKLLRQTKIQAQGEKRVSASHVLLAAGFARGQSWGNVRLNPDHILKIENVSGATAQQIYEVVQNIVTTVKAKLDITLEPEVRFLGEF